MIKINSDDKYEYELNGELKKMDYPSVFQLAEYHDNIDGKTTAKQLLASRDFLIDLGMDETAVKHLKAKQMNEILKNFSEGN